jgi:pyroglutamyl-peptidase
MKHIKYLFSLSFVILLVTSYSSSSVCYSNFLSDENDSFDRDIILVTGFGPFDVYEINPSQFIVEELNGQIINETEIIGIVLPVDFKASVENLTQAITLHNPRLLISTGLSPRAKKMNIEKCAINIKMYPPFEKSWFFPRRLDHNGPFFRFSPFDTKEIVRAHDKAGIPSRQSYYAGFYICNAVFYGALGFIKENELSTKAGFIHVPLLLSQDPDGMDLETMVEGVKIAIETILF